MRRNAISLWVDCCTPDELMETASRWPSLRFGKSQPTIEEAVIPERPQCGSHHCPFRPRSGSSLCACERRLPGELRPFIPLFWGDWRTTELVDISPTRAYSDFSLSREPGILRQGGRKMSS